MNTDIGACAGRGAVGAMAMTGIREFAAGLGVVDETPPEALATHTAGHLLERVPKEHRQTAVEGLHWTVGTTSGAVYGVFPGTLRTRRWFGVAYGLAIGLGFEVVLGPALGLRRWQETRTAERIALGIDHVVYGLILAGR